MHKILRDPLLHFVLLGGLIYAVNFAMNPINESIADNQIRVTAGDIDRFKQIYQKQWHRQPTQAELQVLIRAHLKEEVLYREALLMKLDQDDAIVRRRLAQKVEFLITDVTVPKEVDDKVLMAFYEENIARYKRAAVISFHHIYFNPDLRGDRIMTEASAALQILEATQADENVADDLGDRFMLQAKYQKQSTDDIARNFGKVFTEKLITLPVSVWTGPIKSGYGAHLVYINERESVSVYPFAEVRERVKNDYLFELRKTRNEQVLEKLNSQYNIVIEDNAYKP